MHCYIFYLISHQSFSQPLNFTLSIILWVPSKKVVYVFLSSTSDFLGRFFLVHRSLLTIKWPGWQLLLLFLFCAHTTMRSALWFLFNLLFFNLLSWIILKSVLSFGWDVGYRSDKRTSTLPVLLFSFQLLSSSSHSKTQSLYYFFGIFLSINRCFSVPYQLLSGTNDSYQFMYWDGTIFRLLGPNGSKSYIWVWLIGLRWWFVLKFWGRWWDIFFLLHFMLLFPIFPIRGSCSSFVRIVFGCLCWIGLLRLGRGVDE